MPTDILACWNCGHENPAGAKFCANCGKPQRPACPHCGTPVPEGAKFCANCGAPVAVLGPARAEPGVVLAAESRRVVTVIFADLVGSTGLTERLDPEEARDVVAKFYRVVQQAVERFDGQVANLLGDAVLAVFGLPITHEDDPERAARAGMAIRDAMPTLNDHLKDAHGVSLDVRVGINTGEVVAASGSTFDRDFLVSDAVTIAARLQQSVPPGTVVAGERTYRLTSHVIEYRALPPLDVKGKAAPLPVWEAVALLPERPEEGRRIMAPLIGRHFELGLLQHLYERTSKEGVPHLVTVLGQPGIGKSRLLREFLAIVRDGTPQPMVLRGRNVAFGGQIGYHALLDILRVQAGLLNTDSPEEVRAKLQRWLTSIVPRPEQFLDGLLLTYGMDEGDATDPGRLRQQLFETWQGLLATLGDGRPVIVVLEDIHWADEGTLDLIQWLNERIDASPLFLMCLARPELFERRPAWSGGGRNATTIDLKPLRPQEAEQLVTSLSHQGLASEMRAQIARRAGGNPLFAEELVRMLLEGSVPGATIPDTVQAVLTARIDRLSQAERRLLQAAAVIGRSFWPSATSRLTGLTDDDIARATDALMRKEMIVARSASAIAGEREYAFRHDLTREVAYGMLPRALRQRAHAEAARWLAARLEERAEEIVEILAEHLRLAGDDARAASYLVRAAQKARRLYANADAIRLFDQALEAGMKAGLPPADLVPAYLGRGDVHQLQGNYAMALANYEPGLQAARQSGSPALRAVLESRVGLVHHREMRLAEAEPYFRRAADLARQIGDPLTLGLSLIDLANVEWDRGRLGADDPAIVEGISLLRQAGDQSSLARGLNLLCMAVFSKGDTPGAMAAAHEALTAAREAGDKSREATSLSYLSVVNSFWAGHQDSLRYGRAAIALAEEIGDRRRIAFTQSFIGRSLISLGQWGEAIDILQASLPMLREVAKVHVPWSLFYLGIIYWELGEVRRANEFLPGGEDVATYHHSWREAALLSQLYLALLNHDEGRGNRILDDLIRIPHGIFVPDDAEAVLPVGEALIDVGRLDEVREYVALRRPGILRFAAPPHIASLEILDGRLAAREGRSHDAVERFEKALSLARQSEDVLLQRRALELRLEMLDQPEDREALRNLLRRLAATLPEDLREAFLRSPRTAVLRA